MAYCTFLRMYNVVWQNTCFSQAAYILSLLITFYYIVTLINIQQQMINPIIKSDDVMFLLYFACLRICKDCLPTVVMLYMCYMVYLALCGSWILTRDLVRKYNIKLQYISDDFDLKMLSSLLNIHISSISYEFRRVRFFLVYWYFNQSAQTF